MDALGQFHGHRVQAANKFDKRGLVERLKKRPVH
jgi:hypothetical protein